MTAPSLTHGHGYLNDCDATGTKGQSNIDAGDATQEILYGDILKIEGLCDAANDEQVYVEYDFTNIDNTADTYTRWLCRWKTSASSLGLGARVNLYFTVGTQDLLSSDTVPQFDTSWHLSSGDITSGKTIDKIRFIADDYPDSVDAGTHQVYFDFALLHKGTFTFPHVDTIRKGVTNRYADITIPGRVGDVTQYLGMESPTINLTGKLDIGTSSSWGVPPLEYLERIMHEAHNDKWQWFSTGGLSDADRFINCKVTPRNLTTEMNADATRTWNMELKKYGLSSGSETTWNDMQWMGI